MKKQLILEIQAHGDFMNLKTEFESKFTDNYTISKCKDKGCSLKDISKDNYFMVDGDQLKNSFEKSVDCIIIDLRKNKEGKYKIILCELSKVSKELKNAFEKFQGSGK